MQSCTLSRRVTKLKRSFVRTFVNSLQPTVTLAQGVGSKRNRVDAETSSRNAVKILIKVMMPNPHVRKQLGNPHGQTKNSPRSRREVLECSASLARNLVSGRVYPVGFQ